MRRNAVVLLALPVAVAVGWWGRGIEWRSSDDVAPVAARQEKRATVAPRAPAALQRVEHTVRQPAGTRNLFAYREPPPARVAYVPPPVVERVEAAKPVPVVHAEPAPRLRFVARYIGRFGPDRNPIAAFTRDGRVLTVRVGERIDEHFVLRRIGIESVEVEARDGGDVITERVPLG